MDIIKNTKIWLGISGILIAIALFGFIFKGLNYGIDFTGGNLFQLKFENEVSLETLNPVLDNIAKNIDQVDPRSRKVQISEGNTAIIRTPEMSEEEKSKFLQDLEAYSKYDLQKGEKVGATIGSELKRTAIYALLIGGILIVLYITLRFEFKFAIAAIVALFHDIIIAVGFMAILGYEVNTPFIAAVLTILGYSINDTIVVFDRIRENMKRKKAGSLAESINTSINQVMTRSINTSLTTFLAIVAILIFGGDSLKTFITTLLIGIVVGTYSSIFVASPVVNILEKK
jgi:preprotein translocase subunit SecF